MAKAKTRGQQTSESSTEVSLSYRLTPGDIHQYLLEIGSQQNTVKGRVELLLVQAVLSADQDEIVCESTIAGALLVEGDLTQPLPSLGQSALLRMKPDGRVQGAEPAPQVIFPEAPVRKGESWTHRGILDYAPGVQGDPAARPNVPFTCTLRDFEPLAGYEAAVVEMDCAETRIQLEAGREQFTKVRGRTHFAYREGFLLHSETLTTHRVIGPTGESTSEFFVRLGLVRPTE